jgi:hypothetical protein
MTLLAKALLETATVIPARLDKAIRDTGFQQWTSVFVEIRHNTWKLRASPAVCPMPRVKMQGAGSTSKKCSLMMGPLQRCRSASAG